MSAGTSVIDLLGNPDVSWLILDGCRGRIGVPVVVVEKRDDDSDVRLLAGIGMGGIRISAGTIKLNVPNYAIVASFVGTVPPTLIPAETAP